MKNLDEIYVSLLKDLKENGHICEPARKNMPKTKALFGTLVKIDNKRFPILQGKKINFKNIILELFWMLIGDSNIKFLVKNGCNIWNDDAFRYYRDSFGGKLTKDEFIKAILDESLEEQKGISNPNDCIKDPNYKYGDCGRIYGIQWRSWGDNNIVAQQEGFNKYQKYRKPIDQIDKLIKGLKENPFSRYHIVSAWNPQDFFEENTHYVALPACHKDFQCNVFKREDENFYLDLRVDIRSSDVVLGLPYNIAFYALLQRILCIFTNYKVGDLNIQLGNYHYYENQKEYIEEYIRRFENKEIPNEDIQLEIDSFIWNDKIDNIKIDDFKLINYKSLSNIKAPLSVGL